MTDEYGASQIKIEKIRENFDIVELSSKIKKKGDILILAQELKVKPRILNSAVNEGRIQRIIPDIQKSKAGILSSLRTNREVKIFAEKFDFKKISPKQLREEIIKWKKHIQMDPSLLLTNEEHDLIIGSLLGDSSMRQREINCCFKFSHSIKQKDYAKWKSNILKEFGVSEFREVKRKIKEHFIHAIDFSTHTHQIFNYYRNLFYGQGKKIVTKEILDYLTPKSLAIWICDDGSYDTKQRYIILCTNSFSLEEHKLMKKFFNEKFGLNPTIGFRDGKYYYLRFKQEDSKRLIEIIKPFIPKCMLYKIGGKNE